MTKLPAASEADPIHPITRWSLGDHLHTKRDIARFLRSCLDESGDDPRFVASVLGDLARKYGITHVARESGLTREALHRAFGPKGNPSLDTLARVCAVLGVKLTLAASDQKKRSAA